MAVAPFDWKSLITPAVTLGMKAVGDKVAPDPSLKNANTSAQALQNTEAQNQFNNQQTQFGDQLQLQKIADAKQIRQNILPGMYTNLGYSPAQGRTMATQPSAPAPGQVSAPGVSTAPTLPMQGAPGGSGSPGLGSKIGGAALGIGTSVAPSVIGGLLAKGGESAALKAAGFTADAGSAGGLGSTVAGLASNPITIAGAGALAAGLIWKASQVHPTADKWVQGYQAPFDSNWQTIEKSGLPPDQQNAAKQQSAQNYLNSLAQFAQQGGKNMIVAKQAAQTFRQYYGDPMKYGIQLPF